MDFDEKYKLIERTVQRFADRYGMFTTEDLVNEAWTHHQVRNAEKRYHVIRATISACVDFLRKWYKTGTSEDIRIVHMSVLRKEERDCIMKEACMCDMDTRLLQEDLLEQLTELERTIIEGRLADETYKEIAEKTGYSEGYIGKVNRRMQKRMCVKKKRLLGE